MNDISWLSKITNVGKRAPLDKPYHYAGWALATNGYTAAMVQSEDSRLLPGLDMQASRDAAARWISSKGTKEMGSKLLSFVSYWILEQDYLRVYRGVYPNQRIPAKIGTKVVDLRLVAWPLSVLCRPDRMIELDMGPKHDSPLIISDVDWRLIVMPYENKTKDQIVGEFLV